MKLHQISNLEEQSKRNNFFEELKIICSLTIHFHDEVLKLSLPSLEKESMLNIKMVDAEQKSFRFPPRVNEIEGKNFLKNVQPKKRKNCF